MALNRVLLPSATIQVQHRAELQNDRSATRNKHHRAIFTYCTPPPPPPEQNVTKNASQIVNRGEQLYLKVQDKRQESLLTVQYNIPARSVLWLLVRQGKIYSQIFCTYLYGYSAETVRIICKGTSNYSALISADNMLYIYSARIYSDILARLYA
jgi:hypothetical protein